MKKYVLYVCCAAVLLALLCWPSAVLESLRSAVTICADTLIPSLFPFLVLSGLLADGQTGSRGWLAGALSLLCGYPVAARSFSALPGHSERFRGRMICAMTCAGPAFVLTAVGVGMRNSFAAGAVLLCAQWLTSAVLTAVAVFRNHSERRNPPIAAAAALPVPFSVRLVRAVQGACAAMGMICAQVLLFAALTAILESCGLLRLAADCLPFTDPAIRKALLYGVLEVTSGCRMAAACSGPVAMAVTGFLIGFGGLCVWLQVRSLCGGKPIGPYLVWRFSAGVLCAGFSLLLTTLFPQIEATSASFQTAPTAVSYPACSMLLLLCALFVWLCGENQENSGKNKMRAKKQTRGAS